MMGLKKDWIILLVALALVFLLTVAIISTKKPRVAEELEVLELLEQRRPPPPRGAGEGFEELSGPFERRPPSEGIGGETQGEGGFYALPKEAEPASPYPLPLGERQRARPPGEMKLPEPQLGEEEEFEAEKQKDWSVPDEWEEPSIKELEKIFSEELERLKDIPEEEALEE